MVGMVPPSMTYCSAPSESSHLSGFVRPEFARASIAQRLVRARLVVPTNAAAEAAGEPKPRYPRRATFGCDCARATSGLTNDAMPANPISSRRRMAPSPVGSVFPLPSVPRHRSAQRTRSVAEASNARPAPLERDAGLPYITRSPDLPAAEAAGGPAAQGPWRS